jgi:signal transduction histidine kinase
MMRRTWLTRQLVWLVILSLAPLGWLYWSSTHPAHALHVYQLDADRMNEWKSYGGAWTIEDHVLHNNSDERGAKLLAGSTGWRDYSLNADLMFDGDHGDMGLIIRSGREEEGVDAYDGYYAGLRTADGTLLIGRSDFGWLEAKPVTMPGGVHASVWYRITVTAVGCNIGASAQNLSTGETAWTAITDRPCIASGRIGLRSLATGGMWRNITAVRSDERDYLEIVRHVQKVGQPEFPKREADYNRSFHFLPPDTPPTPASIQDGATREAELHIGDLRDLSRNADHGVAIRGVVTLTNPGLYVEDSTGGVIVLGSTIPKLNVGDEVEVHGTVYATLYSAVLTNATVRPLWSGNPMPPISITPWQAASGTYDNRFIEIEGILTGIDASGDADHVLEFKEGGQSYRAIYADKQDDSLRKLQRNSLIRIRGICVLDRKYTQEQTPFVVLLRSADDIQVLAAPPWWTPWHMSLLFLAVLCTALLCQVIYFRIQQWKASAIMHERERLAHEIHDTMAQNFAGVGYHVQGIRTSIVKSDSLDRRHIADQLSVAYQLIRRCHEDASRTVAMLGSFSPDIENNLLEVLAETARKIAGNRITIVKETRGNALSLNPRLANALVHIGQEAIANAVGHANPTELTLALIYDGYVVILSVTDNGCGFEYTPAKAGFGILGMEKRCLEIGGNLRIVSTVGAGTQITIKAKLHRQYWYKRILERAKKKLPLFINPQR